MSSRYVGSFIIQGFRAVTSAGMAAASTIFAFRFGFVALFLSLSACVASRLGSIAEVPFALAVLITGIFARAIHLPG